MLSRAGSVFRTIALGLVAVSVLAAVPLTALRVGRRLLETVPLAGEDARGARERILGAPSVESLDAIRRAIPADGEYLMVDGGEELDSATFWVRFELAPRRARFVGRLSELSERKAPLRLPSGPRWVVVAVPRGLAVLLDRDELLHRMESQSGPR